MSTTTTNTPALDGRPLDLSGPSVRGGWIADWRPEDSAFWSATGERVARRNLGLSIFSEHVGFSVWSVWSVLVLFLGPDYGFTPAEKFLLTTTPTLVGALLRIPYTFAVAKFGGRNWTVVSAAVLVIPLAAAAAVLRPGVSLSTLLLVAAVAGVGGGNFASSMANINAFFPERRKGWALGLNAGGGNIGVAVVQLVGLAILALAGRDHPRYVLAVYLPLVVAAALGAALRMDNLAGARNEKGAMREVLRDADTLVVSLLYVGTFGSFIGFGFAFGQVLQVQFADTFDTPVKAAYLTFLGPLVGSLLRPLGGVLADRYGGARITFVTFIAMALSAVLVLAASSQHSLATFLLGFVALFACSGVGNGSTYKMIPAIFRAKAEREKAAGVAYDVAETAFRRRSGALIGIAGAVGAFGGVLVNLAFRQSFLDSGSGDRAYVAFLAFYAVCVALTWVVYLRRPSRARARLTEV